MGGTSSEVAATLVGEVREHDVGGFVLQFTDFGMPETLERFMAEVAPSVRDVP